MKPKTIIDNIVQRMKSSKWIQQINITSIRDTRIILGLGIVCLVLMILSISSGQPRHILQDIFDPNSTSLDSNSSLAIDIGEINPTYRDIHWEVNIPENFSLKENDFYKTENYAIFYNSYTDNYYVNIYKGEEYYFEEIRFFIRTEVLSRINEFKTLDRFPNSLLTYYDYRGSQIQEFDLETFEVNP